MNLRMAGVLHHLVLWQICNKFFVQHMSGRSAASSYARLQPVQTRIGKVLVVGTRTSRGARCSAILPAPEILWRVGVLSFSRRQADVNGTNLLRVLGHTVP